MTTTNRGAGSFSCCACKMQRRKCGPNCLTAPYFPPHRHQDFKNVYKFFGLAKFSNHIRHFRNPHLRDLAVEGFIFQANARADDLAGGCLHFIRLLQQDIKYLEAELHRVESCLAFCRPASGHANSTAAAVVGSAGFLGQQIEQSLNDYQERTSIFPSNYPPLLKDEFYREIKQRNQESLYSSCSLTNYKQPVVQPPPPPPSMSVSFQQQLQLPQPLLPPLFVGAREGVNNFFSRFGEGDHTVSFNGLNKLIQGSGDTR